MLQKPSTHTSSLEERKQLESSPSKVAAKAPYPLRRGGPVDRRRYTGYDIEKNKAFSMEDVSSLLDQFVIVHGEDPESEEFVKACHDLMESCGFLHSQLMEIRSFFPDAAAKLWTAFASVWGEIHDLKQILHI